LWSPKDVVNEEDMYKRLAAVDAWSVISVGLKQYALFEKRLLRLVQHNDIKSLVAVAQALEPAHFRALAAQKEANGHYHQLAPLNHFVDILPAESIQSRQLRENIFLLLKDKKNRSALTEVKVQLQN